MGKGAKGALTTQRWTGLQECMATVHLRPSFENAASRRVTQSASVFNFKAGPSGFVESIHLLSLALNTAYVTLTYKLLTSFVWSFGTSSFVFIF